MTEAGVRLEDVVPEPQIRCQCPNSYTFKQCRLEGEPMLLPSGESIRLCDSHADMTEAEIRKKLRDAWSLTFKYGSPGNLKTILFGLWGSGDSTQAEKEQ